MVRWIQNFLLEKEGDEGCKRVREFTFFNLVKKIQFGHLIENDEIKLTMTKLNNKIKLYFIVFKERRV